jgi:hypothetical protein
MRRNRNTIWLALALAAGLLAVRAATTPVAISALPTTNAVLKVDIIPVVTELGGANVKTRYVTLETLLKLAFGGTGLTVGRVPYASATNALADSPLHRISSTQLGVTTATNLLYGSGADLVYENATTTTPGAKINAKNGAGNIYLAVKNGQGGFLHTDQAFLFLENSGYAATLAGSSFQGGGNISLGADSSTGTWTDYFLTGTGYFNGIGAGSANYERLAIQHAGASGIVLNSTAGGTGTARDFLVKSNGTTIAKIALNSGYGGTGVKYLADDGTFKTYAPASATSVQVVGSGANFPFTNSWQNVVFGSGSPSLSITTSGTYLIYYGAAFGANNTFADAFRVHDGTAALAGSYAEGISSSSAGFGGGLGQVHVGLTFTAAITATKTLTLQGITADGTYTGSPNVISTNTIFGAVKLY